MATVPDESRQSLADRSRLFRLTEALSWSVSYGIPINEALSGLCRQHWLFRVVRWLPEPRPQHRFEACIQRLLKDLEHGQSLATALTRQFSGQLPVYYLHGIAAAEAAGALAKVLPHLTERVQCDLQRPGLMRLLPPYVVVLTVVAATLISGLLVFIVPKYATIFSEMLEGRPLPYLTGWAIGLGNLLLTDATLPVLALLLALPAIQAGLRRRAWARRLGNDLMMCLPVLRGHAIDAALAAAAQSMAAWLGGGFDMLQAAQNTAAASEHRWLRRRLNGWCEELAAGQPWHQGWAALALPSPILNWAVANSVERQQPGAGFQLAAAAIADRLDARRRRWQICIEPACIIILGTLIGMFVIGVFMPLPELISHVGD